MKAFLLAAGFGERLRPITERVPKSLVPVLNVPSILYALTHVIEAGITEVMCNVHYRHEDIISFFRENKFFGLDISFSIEDRILGTGGGLKKCEEFFDDDFMMINSDIVTSLNIIEVIDCYRRSSSPCLVALSGGQGLEGVSTVSLDGSRVADFRNALGTGIAPTHDYIGISVQSPLVFRYLEKGFSSVVYTGFTSMIREHSLGYFVHGGAWHDIGSLESYRLSSLALMEEPALLERVRSATGFGPVEISPHSKIGAGAVISRSVVSAGAVMEDGARLINSVMAPGAVLGKNRTAVDSVIV